MSNNSSISCSCGKSELVLNERRAGFSVLCACDDWRPVLSWGAPKSPQTMYPPRHRILFGECSRLMYS